MTESKRFRSVKNYDDDAPDDASQDDGEYLHLYCNTQFNVYMKCFCRVDVSHLVTYFVALGEIT